MLRSTSVIAVGVGVAVGTFAGILYNKPILEFAAGSVTFLTKVVAAKIFHPSMNEDRDPCTPGIIHPKR